MSRVGLTICRRGATARRGGSEGEAVVMRRRYRPDHHAVLNKDVEVFHRRAGLAYWRRANAPGVTPTSRRKCRLR